MKLLVIKIETSHEVEDALTVFAQDNLKALGTEARKRSDFEQAGWLHDSTVVEMDDIKDLPEDMQFMAYFDEEADREQLIKEFTGKLTELKTYGLATGAGKITTSYIADQDWNTAWQKYYHVIDFSRHLAIVPEWEDYQPAFKDQQLIKLDPGLAFGTGNHKTTQLAMMGLERAMVKPMTVVDVGTGSGILAIAAAKLGATDILATDISDESMTAAQQNAALNDLTNIRVQKTSLLANVDGKFDIIVANILAEILLDLIPQMDAHLNDGGQIIFSGIDYLQLPKIEKALDENGFKIDLTMKQGRWIGLAITRKEA
ncbi:MULTISPECIES: 50S ribosomal protein L11 methyltransferase [Lactobacillus]|uniref:Ribosomal protein L11 methyltransferase n=1 Tax=Lactobacillus xujianguonis TaxID=2495899 RepID=A0A437STI4_9LACO|nr:MULTISPECIES: 50S ribosomal protein L11 methyltransferase [Lactobacillus]RVU70218.1 50S ribosomal protein L11 methyltransferase [Lactobacillus xujianguonis]RVU73385.1 50S ribosomal protein L11 methyltransferase [Lactobacillus xujianguonis]